MTLEFHASKEEREPPAGQLRAEDIYAVDRNGVAVDDRNFRRDGIAVRVPGRRLTRVCRQQGDGWEKPRPKRPSLRCAARACRLQLSSPWPVTSSICPGRESTANNR
jgi:hypothetical protein